MICMVKKPYNAMQSELDELLDWFNSDNVDIDKAVAKYEQAQKLLAEMEIYLKEAENKIKKLSPKIAQ